MLWTVCQRETERDHVSAQGSFSHGIAGRYATALFEIAKEEKALDTVERDLSALGEAIETSDDLKSLIRSPVYSRNEQAGAMSALASKMGISTSVSSTVGLMASKRRLFALPTMITSLKALIAQERGEMSAEVTAAKPLTQAQQDKLAATLKERFGKDMKIDVTVDESIIGGLIVKVGSKMIDTSIASRLAALNKTMREA